MIASWLLLGILSVLETSALFIQGTSDQECLHCSLSYVKVPLTLGVMSRCPDAIRCESVIDDVLKQVASKVDISLSFIGR